MRNGAAIEENTSQQIGYIETATTTESSLDNYDKYAAWPKLQSEACYVGKSYKVV